MIELIQFPLSHYNEKVRWALDWKALPHRRTDLLPGPHALTVLRLTGQTQVPVVRLDGAIHHGSAAILAELEARHPVPPLFPAEPKLRDRALEIQAFFDEEVGPLVRRGLFSELVREPDYLCAMFAGGRSTLLRGVYRRSLPLVTPVMRRGMGITGPQSIADALAGTTRGLDFVAEHAGPEGFLVGDAFSVADLTAAALLAPAVSLEDTPMTLPRPRPATVEAWHARWSKHPGADWVRAHYARHRPDSAALPADGRTP